MTEINNESFQILSYFESITGVQPVDWAEIEDSILFLVEPSAMGKAIGKKASNMELLRKTFKKNVEIVENAPDLESFLRRYFRNIEGADIKIKKNNKTYAFVVVPENMRGAAIGRAGNKIKKAKVIAKKRYDCDSVKVVVGY